MRLFLLPISTKRSLIYCQRLNVQLTTKQTYVEKVTAKAGATWVKWETVDSGWQKKLTGWGNELFKRIPFEEWGLKSIPPLSTRRPPEDVQGQEETDVIYPPSVIKPGTVFDVLQKLATERQSLHRKRMWGSIVGMPVTAPFDFRIYLSSTWFGGPGRIGEVSDNYWDNNGPAANIKQAFSGSKHIEHLLQQGLIKSAPSDLLSRIYGLQANKSFGGQFYPDYTAFLKDWKMIEEFQKDRSKDVVSGMVTLSANVQELVKDMDELLRPPDFEANVSVRSDDAPPQNTGPKHDATSRNEPTESYIQELNSRSLMLKQRLAALNLGKGRPAASDATTDGPDEEMLLTTGSGKLLADALQLRELEVEVERAVEQVQKSLAVEAEQKEQKEKLETASKMEGKEPEGKE
ncbi:hypothetical protein MMC27_004363 [Xylographa pallens]|nr:hypothetical protein [Xylographa pallens]